MPGQYVVCANPQLDRLPTESARDAYVPTCFPSATGETDALPVTVTDADVSGVEIRVKRKRIFSVSGIALDSNGTAFSARPNSFSSCDFQPVNLHPVAS